MQYINSPFKKGIVGIISGDLSRYTEWTQSILRLLMPQGSKWRWCHGNGFAIHRNIIVRELNQEDANGNEWHGDWVWFTDDDQPFDPDLLMKLLNRNVDIIQPLVTTRKAPFLPYAYHYDETSRSKYLQLDWPELNSSGIQEVDACGAGGLLVRRHVFEAMADPWFEEGKTAAECIGEDLHFCTKAKELGFKVYVDLDNVSGHIGTFQTWPRFSEAHAKWGTSVLLGAPVPWWIPWDFQRDLKGEEVDNATHVQREPALHHAEHV